MIGKKILVIDDEFTVRQLLRVLLMEAGFEVVTAVNGPDGLGKLYDHHPDLIILDIMMPDIDGWEILSHIRAVSAVPVIILTAIPEETKHVIRGLDGGAVDYISKPFINEILVSRVQAALRQASITHNQANQLAYDDGYLHIDLSKRLVLIEDEPVNLTAREYELLAYLFQHAGRALTYEELLKNAWGTGQLGRPASIHVYLSRLRRKIEKDPSQPCYLQTEHGIGCRGVFS